MEKKLTFEQLPQAVAQLTKEVSEVKKLLQQRSEQLATPPTEQLFIVQEAADFLHLSVPTIYSKVSRRELPALKRGKRLYFSRTDLMEYLKAGRKKTYAEIEAEATNYLLKQ